MTITPIKQETPRDRWGRPLVVPPGGGKPTAYTRCTTYVGCLEDTFNLSRWQQRMVAVGLSERPDLLLQVSTTDRDDKKALNTVCESAMEAAKAHAAATIGTAVHALTEKVDRGEDLGVIPAAYTADIEAYRRETEPLTAVHIEQFSVVDGLQIGGTPDRLVTAAGLITPDGRVLDDSQLLIADVKTGSIEWGIGKIAMQLAVYSRGQAYDFATATRTHYGDVNQKWGLIIHLPAGTGACTLVWVDLEAGWAAVDLATKVRAWRKRKDLSCRVEADETAVAPAAPTPAPTSAPEPAPANDALANRIAAAASVDELGRIWAERYQDFTAEHIELAGARKALLQHGAVA